jgi:hypothetical protein
MFSQYSWWDFIKFVLVLAVPYYAFVLWKYYREDIREWISNRGQAPVATTPEALEEDEDEPQDTGLYTVQTYADPAFGSIADSKQMTQPPKPVQKQQIVSNESAVVNTSERPDVDLSEGVVIEQEPENTFGLALTAEVVRPAERSLASVISAANRLSADEHGALCANDPADAEASEVAGLINEQKGFDSLLAGVSFTR